VIKATILGLLHKAQGKLLSSLESIIKDFILIIHDQHSQQNVIEHMQKLLLAAHLSKSTHQFK
jgi:hypothetical protein